LCLFLLIWGLAALSSVESPANAASPLEIDVTGQQWVWTFTYPQNGNVESDQLYLPENRPVVFRVTSDDVIHSFWVPEMGIKVDANPGMTTTTQTIPDRLGTYPVKCAELCGLLHADMETYAHVVTTADFTTWAATQGSSQ
jgi:cytochrome c oxidase subunit 2